MIFFILFLLLFPSLSFATVLGDAAAKILPGQWIQVPMSNVAITGQSPAWDLLAAAPGPGYDGGQQVWNSTARKLFIQTTEHGRSGSAGFCPESFPSYPHACWKPMWQY